MMCPHGLNLLNPHQGVCPWCQVDHSLVAQLAPAKVTSFMVLLTESGIEVRRFHITRSPVMETEEQMARIAEATKHYGLKEMEISESVLNVQVVPQSI